MKRSRVTLATIEAAAIAALVQSPSTIGRCWWPKSVAVDAAHAARDDDDLDGRAHDHRVELVARLGVVLLGVVERGQRPHLADAERVDVEEHRRGDQRAGEASATGLVGTRDPPHAQATVELEQAPAGAALGPRAAAAGGGAGTAGGGRDGRDWRDDRIGSRHRC